jgi:hypothetical protein
MSDQNERRVVMARRVARKWVRRLAHAEHRFSVLYGVRDHRYVPGLLRSQRDGRVAMESVPTIPDLGIRENFDSVTLWSANREAMVALKDWFEKRGYETTGVW